MTFDQVRKLLLRQAKTYSIHPGSSGLRGWCKAHGVVHSHVTEFVTGQREPANDLLDALGLEWRVMRKRSNA